jgi:ketosteroid isomerase-like protein
MYQAVRCFTPILCTVTLMGVVACQRQGDAPAADVEAVRTADAALSKAVSDRDLERTVAFYASDASILPVAEPIVTGTEAIRREWQHIFAIPGYRSITTTTKVEVSRSGDLGYTQGTYTAEFDLADGTSATERGKWVSVWKKQADGAWKVAVEIYNTDEAPPEHQ